MYVLEDIQQVGGGDRIQTRPLLAALLQCVQIRVHQSASLPTCTRNPWYPGGTADSPGDSHTKTWSRTYMVRLLDDLLLIDYLSISYSALILHFSQKGCS